MKILGSCYINKNISFNINIGWGNIEPFKPFLITAACNFPPDFF